MTPIRRPQRRSARARLFKSTRHASLLAAVALSLCGCGVLNDTFSMAPPPPLGPAATHADLSPWLTTAPTVALTGRLENINVASQWGSFVTWSLAPAGPWVGAEVDTRACPDAAQRLNNCDATIQGKLIDRGDRHLPLLVAERIVPRGAIPCPAYDQPPTIIASSGPSR